jgi:hypothetical protein
VNCCKHPLSTFKCNELLPEAFKNETDCHEKMLGLIFALSSGIFALSPGIFALSNFTFLSHFLKYSEISKTKSEISKNALCRSSETVWVKGD